MKRLLYKKLNDSQFQSKEEITIANNRKAVALYDLTSKTYKIVDLTTSDVLASGSGTSKHKILIKIKESLAVLGAAFQTEKRYSELPGEESRG